MAPVSHEQKTMYLMPCMSDIDVRAINLNLLPALEALLIEHARAAGEPAQLVWQAQNVLHQPGDSAPHDDHFHLRIACSDPEAAAGCAAIAARAEAPVWAFAALGSLGMGLSLFWRQRRRRAR